ncbi:proline-rich protein 36-like [Mobula hypostoma]|uniref:proline-rich protein 36-like n=1 Tax=Mobula hypostoma TaxID=723540 RepID=UPI002FC34853
MFLSLLVWLSVCLTLFEAVVWSHAPQSSLKDNAEASPLNRDGRTLGDIIFDVYAKNASMPSLLERMLADDVGKQTNHEVRVFQPAAAQPAQSQSNGSMRKGVPQQPGQSSKGPPDAVHVAHPQKGIGYAERQLQLFHQLFDRYLNFKAHRTGEGTEDARKELESTCEKILRRKEKRAESGMGDHSSQVGVTTTEADYSHGLSMGDHYQMTNTTRSSQNTSNQQTNFSSAFETLVKTMFFPFAGPSHEAPSQEEAEGRDKGTIRQEVFETDLTQRSPELSPTAEAGTEPQTEEITVSQPNVFTSTTMASEVSKPTSTPDYLKDSSSTSVTEIQTEDSVSTTETHSGNATTSTTPTADFQTVSPFTPTTEKSDFSTPSKGYDLSPSSTELHNHVFPISSKAPQRHSSPVTSRGPQQHGSPTHSVGPQQHGSPTASEGPQQHGFPTISNGAQQRGSLTPSERPPQHGSSTVPVGPQQLRSPTPSKGSYQRGFAIHSKGPQQHSSPKPSKGPQEHRSSASTRGLAKHGLPIPTRGPQQHGSPTPSKRPRKHGSPDPSGGSWKHVSHSAAEVQSDSGTAEPPKQRPGNGLTMAKRKGILSRSLLMQEDEPQNVDDELAMIEFVSTTSPPEGKRHEVVRIEETADSSNESDMASLEKLMKNLNEQFSRRSPTKNDVRNLEAAIERLNVALSKFADAEAPQEPGRGPAPTPYRSRAGQKAAAEPQRPQLRSEPTGKADEALEEVILFPEAVVTGGRAEREDGAQTYLSSDRRARPPAPKEGAQEAKRTAAWPPLKQQREEEGMIPGGSHSAGHTSVLGNAVSHVDAVQPRDGSATRYRRSPLSRGSPPPDDARSRRTPKPSVKVSSPGVKHSPLPISSTERHWGPLHDLPLNARGQQGPASSFIRPPVRAVSSKGPSEVSRSSPKRASVSLSHARSDQGASAHSTARTSSLSTTPKPHILKGPSLSFLGNGRPTASVSVPAQGIPVNRTPFRPVKPPPFKNAPATRNPQHTLRSSAHVIGHDSMYSQKNGPESPIRKRSLLTRPPSPRKHNARLDAPFPPAHRSRQNQPADSFLSGRDGSPPNIPDRDLSGNGKPRRGSQGASRSTPLKRQLASSRATKPSGGVYPPGTGNRKPFLNSGILLKEEPRAVSAGGADSLDQRVRATQPPRNGRRVIPPPEDVQSSNPSHSLRSPPPENVQFSNPSLRLNPPSPENVRLSNPSHSLNPPFPEKVPTSHPFHRLSSPSLGNVRSSSHSRSFRPSSPGNRRTSNPSRSFNPPSRENLQYSNPSQRFNPPFPDIQSSRPSSRLFSAGSRKSLNPSQGLRSSSSGNRRPLHRPFNLNPSSSGILRSSESSRRLNPYSTGNMEHSNRRYKNNSQNLNPSLTENERPSLVKSPPNSKEMSPKLPHRLNPRPPGKGRFSELFYKFTPPASAKKRSHNPNPSSAMDALSVARPNNRPQASSVGRQVPRLHFSFPQKAPQNRPSNSQNSMKRFSSPSLGPRLVAPSTRTSILLIDEPSQISNTRRIHHVHYLKTPMDRSSALRHPTPSARWDRAPFEESAITAPTERIPPNPVTTPPTRRFLNPIPMENVAPSSLNAPSLDIPIRRLVPRLHQSRVHRRPIGLSSTPSGGPNPVAPLGVSPPPEQILLQVTRPPIVTDEVVLLVPDKTQEPRAHHREVVTAVAPLHPQVAVEVTRVGGRAPRPHRLHALYPPASQPLPLSAATLTESWRPLSTSTASSPKPGATAKTSKGPFKHKQHRPTSSEATTEFGKRKINHNKTARPPKKKTSKTYRVKSTPDPVRKKSSRASPNPAAVVPGDNTPLYPPPNKSPSDPSYKKSWRPLLASSPNIAPNEGSSRDPVNGRSEAHSQASAADLSANWAPFLAIPNVGQIAQNHHGHRAIAPSVGLPNGPAMDLDHKEPSGHLGSRQAPTPHGHAAYSPRAGSSRLSGPPSDAIPNRLPISRAYESLRRSVRSIKAAMGSLAFPSRRRTEMAPASQGGPPTLASRRVTSPSSGPIPGHGSLAEAPHSPANPAAQGNLAASRLKNVLGPKVAKTI